SRRRHTRSKRDWSSDVCSSDLATGEVVNVKIELVQGAAGGGGGGGSTFGGADVTAPGQPRYQIFAAPPGSSAESSEGEFNIGYKIGRASCRERVEIVRVSG